MSALRKKPEELSAEYMKRTAELNGQVESLREDVLRLVADNEQLKRDLSEIIEERRKRNAEKRKKKEEQLRKMQEDAQKKMEDDKKRLEDKRNVLNADSLLKNAKAAHETLDKYPESTEDNTGFIDGFFAGEIPEYDIPELPVDPNNLDEPLLEKSGKGSVTIRKSYYDIRGLDGRCTGVIGAGSVTADAAVAGHRTVYQTSAFTSGAGMSDANCPYCWTGERGPGCSVHVGTGLGGTGTRTVTRTENYVTEKAPVESVVENRVERTVTTSHVGGTRGGVSSAASYGSSYPSYTDSP
eukprot:TRINITY_DN6594_c0_g1_i1.p1 TRINITY_DN6594_c0_g1~~TRINITY_DN6594_c0_g1_i1.p1  ORF type:complete len:297 (-),score=84.79 TRINITY_DN6594_c0_g1_i1:192-1082(-)